MTLEKACSAFLDHCHSAVNLSDHTRRAYRADLKDFRAYAEPSTALSALTKENLRGYIRHLRDTRQLKETTIKRRIACLKLFFRWVRQEGMTTSNPFDGLHERIRLPRRLPRALGSEEVALLSKSIQLASNTGDIQNLTTRITVKLLVTTGIRVGELVRIDISDLDLADGTLKIHGKGNRQRLVYLFDPALNQALERYLARRRKQPAESSRLFITQRGGAYTTQKIRKLLGDLATKAGIERRITPHMLRHTTATQLLEAGVDIRYVQKLLGHQSISTTEIYTHVTDQGLRGALRRAYQVSR